IYPLEAGDRVMNAGDFNAFPSNNMIKNYLILVWKTVPWYASLVRYDSFSRFVSARISISWILQKPPGIQN
ncbi:MAG: hypothetical protein ACOCXC_05480, partial [Fibrobacterota bacterium]